MKYRIEYSGGTKENTWNGFAIIDASSLPEAVRKIENQIVCTPAKIDAVFVVADAADDPPHFSGATCPRCGKVGKCIAAFDDGKQAYRCKCGQNWDT